MEATLTRIKESFFTTPCHRYNVEDLLNDYSRAREFVTPGSATSRQFSSLGAQEVCAGLREYFNTTLGSQLLYKFERVQYADILKVSFSVLKINLG